MEMHRNGFVAKRLTRDNANRTLRRRRLLALVAAAVLVGALVAVTVHLPDESITDGNWVPSHGPVIPR